MALKRSFDPTLDALIRKAAAEVKRLNPHIGEAQSPVSEDEYAQLCEDAQELERIWDAMERQSGRVPASYSASDAVDEDRGE